MNKLLLSLGATALISATLFAAPSNKARLDVAGLDGVKIPVVFGKTVGCSLNYTNNKYPLFIATAPASKEWKTATFTFNPEASGNLIVTLMGEWAKSANDRSWIIYDSISIKGAKLGNGDFRKGLSGWWKSGPTKLVKVIDSDKTAGKKAVQVNHDNGLTTRFAVTKDQPVTITIVYRLAD